MCIKALDKNQPISKIPILQAMTTLVSYLNAVLVIVNCFPKAGTSDSSQQVALTDEDDPFKELIKEIDELQEGPKSVLAKSFTSAASDTKILSQILGDNDDSLHTYIYIQTFTRHQNT